MSSRSEKGVTDTQPQELDSTNQTGWSEPSINSASYWNARFGGDWDEHGGREQTRFFAELALRSLPAWIARDIAVNKLTVLDWGCAEGDATEVLGCALGTSVTGVDIAERAVELARSRFSHRSFSCSSVDGLDTYDVLFCSNTLEHFQNPLEILQSLLARIRKYALVLVPFREGKRHEEHFVTFDLNSFPYRVGEFYLLSFQVIDTASLPNSWWPGQQILVIYANEQAVPPEQQRLSTIASSLLDERDSLRTEVTENRQKLEASQHQLEASQHQLEDTQRDLATAQREHAETQAALENALRQGEETRHELTSGRAQLEEARAELVRQQHTIAHLQAKASEVVRTLQEIAARLRSVAKTKPYRLAHLLRRLERDLIKGGRQERAHALSWLRRRLVGRQTPRAQAKNPLLDDDAVIVGVGDILVGVANQLGRLSPGLATPSSPSLPANGKPTGPFAPAARVNVEPYRKLASAAAVLSGAAPKLPSAERVLSAFARLPRIRVIVHTPGAGLAIYEWLCQQTWPAWVLQTTAEDARSFSGNGDPRLASNQPSRVPCDVTWTLDRVPDADALDSFEKAVGHWLVRPNQPFRLPGPSEVSVVPEAAPLPSDAVTIARDLLSPLLVTAGTVPANDLEWLRTATMRNPGCRVVAAVEVPSQETTCCASGGEVLTVSGEELNAYQKLSHALVATPAMDMAVVQARALHHGKWLLAPPVSASPFVPFLAFWGPDRPAPAVWRCPQPSVWSEWSQGWGARTPAADTHVPAEGQGIAAFAAPPPALTKGWVGLWVDRLDKGGLEETVANLAMSFAVRGIRVRVLCSLAGGYVADRLRAAGVPVVVFHGDEGMFANYLRADPPLVLNSQFVREFLHVPKRLGIQLVEVIQNVYGFFSEDEWAREVSDRAPAFDHFIAVSKLAKEFYVLKNPSVKPEAITVVPNAIDYHRLDRANRAFAEACGAFASDQRRFICVGTVEPRKNQIGVLEAFMRFCQRTPHCRARLIFVGNSTDDSYLERFRLRLAAARLPEGCAAEFHEFRGDISDLQVVADACVVGSYLEGLSLAACESLALGGRLIHTSTGGAEELCGDGVGWLVPNPAGDPFGVAPATLSGTETVAECIQAMADAFAAVYAQATPEHSAGARRSGYLKVFNSSTQAQGYLSVLSAHTSVPQTVARPRHTNGGVLAVATRNLCYPTGELSLIANRAQAIHALTGAATRLLAFQAEGILRARQTDAVAAPYFQVEAFVPISQPERSANTVVAEVLQRELAARLWRVAPEVLVLSSWPQYLPAFRTLLPQLQECRKHIGTKLVYDMHASVDEAWEYGLSQQGEEGRAFFAEILRAEEDILNAMDGAFVVSHALIDYVGWRHHVQGPLRCFRIPCGVHTPFASPEEMRAARSRWRRELGIDEEEVVFVYSGGFGPWQMLEESLAQFFGSWSRRLNARLCVFTREGDLVWEHVRQQGYDESRLIIRSLQPQDVVPVLTAADVALLLRRDNWTNRVAFPNKFSEYIAAGLLILTTSALRDPTKILCEGGFGIAPPDLRDLSADMIASALAERNADMDAYYRRALATCESALNYEQNCQAFAGWLAV